MPSIHAVKKDVWPGPKTGIFNQERKPFNPLSDIEFTHTALYPSASAFSPDEISTAMKKTSEMRSPKNFKKLNKFLKLKKSDIYIEKLIKYLD